MYVFVLVSGGTTDDDEDIELAKRYFTVERPMNVELDKIAEASYEFQICSWSNMHGLYSC